MHSVSSKKIRASYSSGRIAEYEASCSQRADAPVIEPLGEPGRSRVVLRGSPQVDDHPGEAAAMAIVLDAPRLGRVKCVRAQAGASGYGRVATLVRGEAQDQIIPAMPLRQV